MTADQTPPVTVSIQFGNVQSFRIFIDVLTYFLSVPGAQGTDPNVHQANRSLLKDVRDKMEDTYASLPSPKPVTEGEVENVNRGLPSGLTFGRGGGIRQD